MCRLPSYSFKALSSSSFSGGAAPRVGDEPRVGDKPRMGDELRLRAILPIYCQCWFVS